MRLDLQEKIYRALRAAPPAGGGLVLVCGGRGAGKTTTLYTLLDLLSVPHLALSTVEEKIEFTFPRVAQVATDPSIGLTTAAALRATLKTDPDVVLVGAVADVQAAALVVEAANRGILVLAGVEATSAVEGLQKLLALGVKPQMLGSTLRAAVGVAVAERVSAPMKERLSRAQEADLEPRVNFGAVLAALKEEGTVEKSAQWKDVAFAISGTPEGIVGLQEVLENTATTRHLIQQGASAEELEAAARAEGMLTELEDQLCKAAAGVTKAPLF